MCSYVEKPHSLQEMKDHIQREIDNILKQKPSHVSRNIFRRLKACLEAGRQQFETLP
jgi:hypothetical protein